MKANELLFRNREKSEGVVVAQIRFCGIGNILNIRKGFDLFGGDTVFFKTVMIELYVFVAIINEGAKAFKLKTLKVAALHAFLFFVPYSVFHF